MAFLHRDMFGTPEQERDRFRQTAEEWMKAERPLRLHLGFGQHPMRDFLNLDFRLCVRDEREPADFHENCFIFDWPMGLPLPDNCVDFVFHEDMFEHLDQKQQFELLAEVFRVLTPGRFHRINCPNIAYIMRAASDFSKGRAGVYDEWSRWSHVNVPTKASLEEQAKIVGYEKVHFNGKNQTVSGVWFRERRPGGQYDQNAYNIFADLEKPAATTDTGTARAKPAWTDPENDAIIPGDEHALELVRLVEAGDTAAAWKLYEGEGEAIDYSTRDNVHLAAMRLGLALERQDVAIKHALRVNARNRYLALHRPEWVYEVARVLDSSGEHAGEAHELRERLHEVGARFPQIYLRVLGKIAPKGDEPGADALIEWLLARPVDDPELAERLAARLQAAGRADQATELCLRQLESTADHPQLLNRAARGLLLASRLEEAVPVLERARAGNPDDEWTSITLANVLRKLGRPMDARAVLTDFLERSPAHASALAIKARIEWTLGQRSDAAATARQAIEAKPGDSAVEEAMQAILAKA